MQLSSTATLYLKFLVTIFWTVFFGSFAVAFWFLDDVHMIGGTKFRLGFTVFVFIGVLLLYSTLFRLKRVDTEAGALIITNYFKSYRFPFALIDRVKVLPVLFSYKIVVFYFIKPTAFGKKIFFLTNTIRLGEFEQESGNLFGTNYGSRLQK